MVEEKKAEEDEDPAGQELEEGERRDGAVPASRSVPEDRTSPLTLLLREREDLPGGSEDQEAPSGLKTTVQ